MMHQHPHGMPTFEKGQLRVLAWETTKACPLACPHCRASAVEHRDPDELSTEEGYKMLESAAEVGKSIIILSGGEPLLREDLELLAAKAVALGHRPVVSCNDGSLLTEERIKSLAKAGIKHFSFSMHSEKEEDHDKFVRKAGAYKNALQAFERIKSNGLSFQINTTVLPGNYQRLDKIMDWVVSLGASAWHLFFIVPTGRASEGSAEVKLTQEQTNKVLEHISDLADLNKISIKVTCAPQYAQIRASKGKPSGSHGRSCMAGNGYIFVSYKGEVKPCGYFDMVVGSVREKPLADIYKKSQVLVDMREQTKLTGACGVCRFKTICGGCRARAFAVNNDYMSTDPNCKFCKNS